MVVVGAGAALGPLPGAAALVAAALAVVAVLRPEVAALTLAAVAPATSGLARGLPIPGLRLSEALIAGLSVLILVTPAARERPRWGAFDWLALAYVVATAVLGLFDVLRRGDYISAQTAGALLGPMQFLLLYRALLTALPEAAQRRRALRAILVASVPVSLLALAQQFDVPGVRALLTTLTGTDIYASTVDNTFGFAESVARATGPFPHWHDLGGYLLIVTLIGFGLLLEGSGRVLRRRWLVVILAPALIALVQTATIAVVVGLIGGAILLGVWARRTRVVLAWTVVGMVVAGAAFAPLVASRFSQQFEAPPGAAQSLVPQTISYRLTVWRQLMPTVSRNLVTGYGPLLPPGLAFPHSESLYLEMLLRGGLPLLAVYLALMWALAARAVRTTRVEEPDQRTVGHVVLAMVILLVFIHLIETYFIDSGPPHVLWALAGLLVADRRRNPVSAQDL